MSLGAVLAAFASFAVLAVMFVPLERSFPARVRQVVLRAEIGTDVVFFLGQYLVFTGVAIGVLDRTRWALADLNASHLHAWALRAPFVACALAVAAGDILVYWFHRACHSWHFLWRFHAVHHSSEELDWLAAHREHPLDGISTQLCQNLPAMVLGIPVRWLAALALFRGVWAIFVHSNVRLPLGPVRWVLGAPELHRWHHAKVERTHHNFANLAPWVDHLFGTHAEPPADETYALGVEPAYSAPRGAGALRAYAMHLLRPFWHGRSCEPEVAFETALTVVANHRVAKRPAVTRVQTLVDAAAVVETSDATFTVTVAEPIAVDVHAKIVAVPPPAQ